MTKICMVSWETPSRRFEDCMESGNDDHEGEAERSGCGSTMLAGARVPDHVSRSSGCVGTSRGSLLRLWRFWWSVYQTRSASACPPHPGLRSVNRHPPGRTAPVNGVRGRVAERPGRELARGLQPRGRARSLQAEGRRRRDLLRCGRLPRLAPRPDGVGWVGVGGWRAAFAAFVVMGYILSVDPKQRGPEDGRRAAPVRPKRCGAPRRESLSSEGRVRVNGRAPYTGEFAATVNTVVNIITAYHPCARAGPTRHGKVRRCNAPTHGRA